MSARELERCAGHLGRKGDTSRGFTMIELMVVLAIIMLAAGIMAPPLVEFFANRQLDGIRGEFGTVFNRARLRAVTEGRDMSVVFFQEGARIYDELNGRFVDGEIWNPDGSYLAGEDGNVWYLLGFADNKVSYDAEYWTPVEGRGRSSSGPAVPPYSWWEAQRTKVVTTTSRRARRRSTGDAESGRVSISGLYKVTFHRDGTLSFGLGSSDVTTALYNLAGTSEDGDPPKGRADIMVLQSGNNSACYIDLRPTGQMKSKIVVLPEAVSEKNPFEQRKRR